MGQLEIMVVEARNLKQKDKFSANDAYVQIYLDDKKQKQKTKAKQNSNNPTWNETLVFNHLRGQDILHVDVYDEDTLKDDKIGSLEIDLNHLYKNGHMDNWFHIPGKSESISQGEIHLILRYQQLKI